MPAEGFGFDSGPQLVCDEPAATYEHASDEHGRLAVSAATKRLGLGDKIRLIPGATATRPSTLRPVCCVRGNRVERLWPVTARGKFIDLGVRPYRRQARPGMGRRRRRAIAERAEGGPEAAQPPVTK
jgi:hypothetical protein